MERTIDRVIRLYTLLKDEEITLEQHDQLRDAVVDLLQEVIVSKFLTEEGES